MHRKSCGPLLNDAPHSYQIQKSQTKGIEHEKIENAKEVYFLIPRIRVIVLLKKSFTENVHPLFICLTKNTRKMTKNEKH